MKPERWQKIEGIYHVALEREEGQRAAFLNEACGGDEALRQEVESLLAQEGATGSFLEAPALEVAAKVMSEDSGRSLLGRQLGSYQVLSLLGTGGMGEVYRAHDRKLSRDVALKVLPKAFAQDPERLGRLEREARMLASLNHPHIGAIHTLEESEGVRFLVLELVPGETLAERLKAGPLEVPEALRVCAQIAEALEAAHERGVIHRDLKPANVKVTPEGQVKVLDFGLAKAQGSPDLSQAPTVSATGTETGAILGTPAYMSPEQARGRAVDKRTDIWAFGCVLYELITGQRAFARATVSDTIAAILEREPDWQALPQTTPGSIQALLRRCLRKDSNRRLHDIADARIEIEEALSEPPKALAAAEMAIGAAQPAPWRRAIPWVLAGLLTIMLAVALWSLWQASPPAQQPVSRVVINLPQGQTFDWGDVSISPDGTQVAYIANTGGTLDTLQLYVRRLNELDSRPVPGTAGAFHGGFSPDGKWLAFGAFDGLLKKVSLSGGAVQTLCNYGEITEGQLGVSWTPNGDALIFAGDDGLFRVSAAGGTPEVLASVVEGVERYHAWPQVLPGGKAVLFTVGQTSGPSVAVLSLETGERRTLIGRGSYARYVPTGHLVYSREDKLLAAPFDLDQLQVTGPPAVVLERLAIFSEELGETPFSVSESGSLVYFPSGGGESERTLVWVDHQGAVEPLTLPPQAYDDPRLSPDGQWLAVQIGPGGNSDIWIYHISRGTLTRLTFEGGNLPLWMPDGKRVTFASSRAGGAENLFWKPADGSGPAEQLTESERLQRPSSWSLDGQVLAFSERHSTTGLDIWVLPLQGERKPRPFLQTQFQEAAAVFSPDGHWLAYTSDESGRPEVYVQPYPGPGGKWQISTEGGNEPVWVKNGRELFYRDGNKMMAVPVTTQPTFRAGPPTLVFDGQYFRDVALAAANYDITRDGQRFLMIQLGEQQGAPTQINVVLNWFEELKRLVPTEQN